MAAFNAAVQVVCQGQATVVFWGQQYKPIRASVKVKDAAVVASGIYS